MGFVTLWKPIWKNKQIRKHISELFKHTNGNFIVVGMVSPTNAMNLRFKPWHPWHPSVAGDQLNSEFNSCACCVLRSPRSKSPTYLGEILETWQIKWADKLKKKGGELAAKSRNHETASDHETMKRLNTLFCMCFFQQILFVFLTSKAANEVEGMKGSLQRRGPIDLDKQQRHQGFSNKLW